jgi:hypothetical protein
MSDFTQELQAAASLSSIESLDSFQKNIPQAWIKEALKETGRATVRKRRFPAQQAVWLVLGIGLMRNRSIAEVCDKLELAFPDSQGNLPPLASSSVTNARAKLGYEPLRYLFYSTAEHWEKEDNEHAVCGLKVFSVDGTQFRVPDTSENQSFGFASGQASFPSVLAVALMSVKSHLIADVAFGPITQGEVTYAQKLVGSAPENSLTLFDRAYFGAELLLSWQQAGRRCHWLTPVKQKMRYDVIERFSDYDCLIEMPVSPQARKKAPHLPEKWQARMVTIPQPSGEIKGFITSMVDPQAYPLEDILHVYWERWEIEQGYGELKRGQLDDSELLRSLKKEGVYQELWGILIAYNLVRLEMMRMAEEHGVHPLRISFINALRLIQDEFLWCSGRTPGTVPKKLQNLRAYGKRLILPPKRKRPSYPREVLAKPAKYRTKKKAARC